MTAAERAELARLSARAEETLRDAWAAGMSLDRLQELADLDRDELVRILYRPSRR